MRHSCPMKSEQEIYDKIVELEAYEHKHGKNCMSGELMALNWVVGREWQR